MSANDVNDLDDELLQRIDLLYWSVLSHDSTAVSHCIYIYRSRNLLPEELKKLYPNASILDVIARTASDQSLYTRRGCFAFFDEKQRDILQMLLGCEEIEKKLLLNKFENKNLFEFSLNHLDDYEDLFLFLFSDSNRCDFFFRQGIGFEAEENEMERITKYEQWGGDILFSAVNKRKNVEAVTLGVVVLKRYGDYLLMHEFSRIRERKTLLQWVHQLGKYSPI